MSISSSGCDGGGAETAWVNKDYVTGALMSFSSKQLLPPSFYLIKELHLQQIPRRHAPLDRWQRESVTSAGIVTLWVIFDILFVKLTQALTSSHSVFKVWVLLQRIVFSD